MGRFIEYASDEEIIGYVDTPRERYPIEVTLLMEDADEALACVIALAKSLGTIKAEFIQNDQGGLSSGALSNTRAFKVILNLHDQLREAVIDHDTARWGEPREFECWGTAS